MRRPIGRLQITSAEGLTRKLRRSEISQATQEGVRNVRALCQALFTRAVWSPLSKDCTNLARQALSHCWRRIEKYVPIGRIVEAVLVWPRRWAI